MLSEIGSNFWIDPRDIDKVSILPAPESLGFDGSDYVWMSTGRSATAFVLDAIENRNPRVRKVAVIPPFTCHTVIEPFLARGYEVKTFYVGRNLIATAIDILEAIKECNASVLLFHRYFGVDTVCNFDSIMPELKAKGVVIIEDCTQSLYSGFNKSDADYLVGSIRKWCGVPDGGFAVCKEGKFENKPTEVDYDLQEAKKEASLLKYHYLFDGFGEKQTFLNRYREAEDILDSQNRYYSISELSACIQSNLDIDDLKAKRRNNFRIIIGGLAKTKGVEVIFKDIKEDEVPLYCPILCENRSRVQTLLVKNSIYAPVVWPKPDCCPEVDAVSDYIYAHILCIPIDQRYDADDMERVIKVLNEK